MFAPPLILAFDNCRLIIFINASALPHRTTDSHTHTRTTLLFYLYYIIIVLFLYYIPCIVYIVSYIIYVDYARSHTRYQPPPARWKTG